jgi:hypothetical protein
VSSVRYELGVYIPEDGVLHSHRRENLKSYMMGGSMNYAADMGSVDILHIYMRHPSIRRS